MRKSERLDSCKTIAIEMSEGSVAAKEAAATKICSKEYLEYLEAESRCEIVKTLIADCRAVLSTRQSLLSAEIKLHEATKYLTP